MFLVLKSLGNDFSSLFSLPLNSHKHTTCVCSCKTTNFLRLFLTCGMLVVFLLQRGYEDKMNYECLALCLQYSTFPIDVISLGFLLSPGLTSWACDL